MTTSTEDKPISHNPRDVVLMLNDPDSVGRALPLCIAAECIEQLAAQLPPIAPQGETPRTDALANEPCPTRFNGTLADWHQQKYRDFARHLERELAAERARAKVLQAEHNAAASRPAPPPTSASA